MITWSLILGILGIVIIVTTAIILVLAKFFPDSSTLQYLNDIGIQAFFFFGLLIGGNAIWLWSDAKDKISDIGALPIQLSLFKTTRSYTIATLVVGILTMLLYILLW